MNNGEFGQIDKGEGWSSDEKKGTNSTGEMTWGDSEKTKVNQGVLSTLGNATVGASGIPVVEEVQKAEDRRTLTDNRTTEEVAIGAPEIAKDGEKLEDRYAEEAEKITAETRNDPNRRMIRVAQLRKDYQMARFNRERGARNG